MKKSVRLFIKGSVQGVFFRRFVEDNANKLGIRGFIRNLQDGRVEIFIEGNLEEVKQMIELCKKGPPHAQVRSVEEKTEKFQDFKDFKVLHI
jgi:acylphosphatase